MIIALDTEKWKIFSLSSNKKASGDGTWCDKCEGICRNINNHKEEKHQAILDIPYLNKAGMCKCGFEFNSKKEYDKHKEEHISQNVNIIISCMLFELIKPTLDDTIQQILKKKEEIK